MTFRACNGLQNAVEAFNDCLRPNRDIQYLEIGALKPLIRSWRDTQR